MPITAALPSKAPYYGTGKAGATKNNGGTIFYGGTIANAVNSSMGITYLGFRSGLYEAKPFLGSTPSNIGLLVGLSGGAFATMAKGKYVMITFTSQIAGIANTLLNSPASFGQKGGQNFWTGTIRTPQYIMPGGWDYTTGMPKARPNPGTQMPSTADPSVYPGSVPEQYPGTRAIPGRIFFIAAGVAKDGVPTGSNYKAKTD
jgi:hypothetical protein